METSEPETPEILERSLARSRRRRAVAAGVAVCACLLVAGVALALRDPGGVEVATIDRPTPTRPATTQQAPTSHTALAPTTLPPATLPPATLPPATLPPTTGSPTPQPAPPQSLVLPPPMVQDVAFEVDITLHRFRGELVSVGTDHVEIQPAGGGITRLALGDDVRIGLVVAHRPCCATVTATSTSVLRPGQTYLFGSAGPHQDADGATNPYFGEPIAEIVNAIPPGAYVGMDLQEARRLAIEHQGLDVSGCEQPSWPVVGEGEWCGSLTMIRPAEIWLTHSKGVVVEARWCC